MRYRYQNGGTDRSLTMVHKNLSKVGRVFSIRGYRYFGRYLTTHEAVMIKGEKGSARFGGFCWSYFGEGPRGLTKLLQLCGVPVDTANSIAFNSVRNDVVGTDWELKATPNGWQVIHEVKKEYVQPKTEEVPDFDAIFNH